MARWVHGVCEPETGVFGGASRMALAHAVFCEDSRHILAYLGRRSATPGTEIGRRELALLLGSAFLRGARLDWFEQADVWAKIAPPTCPPPALCFVPGVMEALACPEFGGAVFLDSQATVLGFLFSNSMGVSQPIAECRRCRL
ncbi:thiopeptide-type bacteriocin biosynthesis protein [Nocardiopsis dassonvillei]|nr:thiopeptide-type bacteriocin biosynthesis protein [Nocardiopsis dassonvillei]MCP3017177.1 thiopeptide-type bacteriocin biosynthesis protein [Nocardiopsis dassonvillei]